MSICKGITQRGNPCKCRVKVGKNFCHYHINSSKELINWDNEPNTFYPIAITGLNNFPTLNEIRLCIVYKEPNLTHLHQRMGEIMNGNYTDVQKIFILSELILVHRELVIKTNEQSWIKFIETCMNKFTENDRYINDLKEYHDNFRKKLHYSYRLEHKKKYIEFICSKSEYKDIITNITSFIK